MPAEFAPELAVDPDPLAHRNLPGEFHVPVAQFGVGGKCHPGLAKEYGDPLAGYFFCLRGAGTFFHGNARGFFCIRISVPCKKGRGFQVQQM